MSLISHPVLELRQYALRPGQGDVLVELFEREFIETQEAAGMAVLGQFRDLDDPDRFVWLRGFDGMPARAAALDRFYGGPTWRAHRERANATMVDSDDVLLLRPVALPAASRAGPPNRPPVGAQPPSSRVLATIYRGDRPFDDAFAAFFDREARPALAAVGAAPLACLRTEYAENTFPALPVREGEHVFVWLARFADRTALDAHPRRLAASPRWRDRVAPALAASLTDPPQRLRLAPTGRSLLR